MGGGWGTGGRRVTGSQDWATRLRVLLFEIRPLRQAATELRRRLGSPTLSPAIHRAQLEALVAAPPQSYAMDATILNNIELFNRRNFGPSLDVTLSM